MVLYIRYKLKMKKAWTNYVTPGFSPKNKPEQ